MEQPQPSQPLDNQPPRENRAEHVRRFLSEYAWFIVRNLVGWILVLSALPVGFLFPGPLGFPIFLIGFALITFPGKRRLTARVLRGKAVSRESKAFRATIRILAVLLPGVVI